MSTIMVFHDARRSTKKPIVAGINPELHCDSWDYEAALSVNRYWRKLVEEARRLPNPICR